MNNNFHFIKLFAVKKISTPKKIKRIEIPSETKFIIKTQNKMIKRQEKIIKSLEKIIETREKESAQLRLTIETLERNSERDKQQIIQLRDNSKSYLDFRDLYQYIESEANSFVDSSQINSNN